jgi:hypothetical protein
MDRREELIKIVEPHIGFPEAPEILVDKILSWIDEHYEEKKCPLK